MRSRQLPWKLIEQGALGHTEKSQLMELNAIARLCCWTKRIASLILVGIFLVTDRLCCVVRRTNFSYNAVKTLSQ